MCMLEPALPTQDHSAREESLRNRNDLRNLLNQLGQNATNSGDPEGHYRRALGSLLYDVAADLYIHAEKLGMTPGELQGVITDANADLVAAGNAAETARALEFRLASGDQSDQLGSSQS